jgi:AraC family transcriptional regulator of adaptative response/methylated-DNA-[protein]-cysteine methyltransferase
MAVAHDPGGADLSSLYPVRQNDRERDGVTTEQREEGMLEAEYHFRLVARAIARIAEEAPEAVPLAALAAESGLSPFHFQRVFSRWAGVSPKRFAQYLVLRQARHLLANHRALLDVSLETGLSGPGRLHDLLVTWEAMTPGAYARAGAGLEIDWATLPSPFGPAVVMATAKGICALGFAVDGDAERTRADLAASWPAAAFRHDPERVRQVLGPAFDLAGPTRRPKLHLIGGPFQLKVWEALLRLPEGTVATYADVAVAIGRPTAARAVGNAVGRNPVAWIVPCHRVLRGAGGLGGYRWGIPLKRSMLAIEAARIDDSDAPPLRSAELEPSH